MTEVSSPAAAGSCIRALLEVLAAADDGTFTGTITALAAEAWPSSPKSAASVIRRIEGTGLVSIERSANRRATSVTITEAGRAEIGAETTDHQLDADSVCTYCGVRQPPGRIELKTRADIDAMVSTHPMGEALAEGVIAAAVVLDRGVEDKSYAGVMREWRSGLIELAKYAAAGADELDEELSEPTDTEER